LREFRRRFQLIRISDDHRTSRFTFTFNGRKGRTESLTNCAFLLRIFDRNRAETQGRPDERRQIRCEADCVFELVFVRGTRGQPYALGERGLPVEVPDFLWEPSQSPGLSTHIVGSNANVAALQGPDLPVENIIVLFLISIILPLPLSKCSLAAK